MTGSPGPRRSPERPHGAHLCQERETESARSEDAKEAGADRRRTGRKQLPDRQEANADSPPEMPESCGVIPRPPTQGRGDHALDVEQKPPEARTSKTEAQALEASTPPRSTGIRRKDL